MYRLLLPPYPSQLSDDKRALKCSVIPWYSGIRSSIRINIDPLDNCSFVQIGGIGEWVYKLFVSEFSLSLYKLRFSGDSVGYQLNVCDDLIIKFSLKK